MARHTIAYLTEYYKDAETVKCLTNERKYKVPNNFKVVKDGSSFKIPTPRSYIRISYGSGEMAKIMSSKIPSEPQYEIY